MNDISAYAVGTFLIFLGGVIVLLGELEYGIPVILMGSMFLYVPSVFSGKYLPSVQVGKTITVTKPKQTLWGLIYAKLRNNKLMNFIAKDTQNVMLSGVITTGTFPDPHRSAKQMVTAFIIMIFVAGATSMIGMFVFNSLLFLLVFVAPFIILLIPRLNIKLGSSDVSVKFEDEFAYFLAYVQISLLSGFSLFDAMIKLLDKNILRSIEKYAAMMKKWKDADGLSEKQATNRVAKEHPFPDFQTFLFSHYEINESNPKGLDQYVNDAADLEFRKLVVKNEKKIGKVNSIFMMGAMAMIMAPVLMTTMMFVASGESDNIQMMTIMMYIIPVVFLMYSFFVSPFTADAVYKVKKTALIGAVPGFVLFMIPTLIPGFPPESFKITLDVLACLSLMIAIPCLINGHYVGKQIGHWNSIVNGFPKFTRDLIEKLKIEANFVKSVTKIINSENLEYKYGKFTNIIDDVRVRLFAVSYKKKPVFYDGSMHSQQLKLFLFIMETVFQGGHKKSITAMEKIYKFANELVNIRNQINSSLKMSSMLLYAAPIVFFIAMLGLVTMLVSFTSGFPDISTLPTTTQAAVGDFFNRPDFSNVLISFKPIVVLMSLCAGLIVSKLVYATVRATTPIGITMMISFIILSGWTIFIEEAENILVNVF